MMQTDERRWELLEQWLREVAGNEPRKGVGLMVDHWLRIGRAMRLDGADDIAVCGGYGHDVHEDAKHVSLDNLGAAFEAVLGNPDDASTAVQLVLDCSYSDEEIQLEAEVAAVHGKKAGKSARKAMACARWVSHEDPRVHLVKIADVKDNEADCDLVSAEFAADYRSWAVPLRSNLQALVSAPRP